MDDNSVFLQRLYDEYTELKRKLNSVESTIISYGGSIPTLYHTPATTTVPPPPKESSLVVERYPMRGTWKEKIVFTLKSLHNQPSIVSEIVNFLHLCEPDLPLKKLSTYVTQYCSVMGKDGELGVEEGYRNKYFLKEK